jgi:ABC-2 type transport system permease protein
LVLEVCGLKNATGSWQFGNKHYYLHLYPVLLFLSVLSLALGNNRGDVLGYSFISFLAPGLIAMSILTQSFSHSVSSLMIGKIQGNIVDMLYAPLSAFEVSIAIILGSLD